MNNFIGQYSLDDVLDAYSEASEIPSREILAEWIARYPQFEHELIEFTVAWIQSEELPEIPGDQKDLNARLQGGLRIVQEIYEKRSAEDQTQNWQSRAKMASMIMEGSLLGWSTDQFAGRINLSVAILRKLENRLIDAVTIPIDLIKLIGVSIQRDPSEIIAYLGQPPMLQSGQMYKSKQPPIIGKQQGFFDAIRNDGELTDDQRTYWLSLESGTE
ncbi:MAG: hypothetical protein JMDDDDMK_00168 [Acidobacteria bacterium]|nr:hypothetical protein [Acidobacteriota bacterium]